VGKPFWLLPEGDFLAVEQKNGRIVDPVLFRKSNDRWNSEVTSERETKNFPFAPVKAQAPPHQGRSFFYSEKEGRNCLSMSIDGQGQCPDN
jgi:hypothetical protein